MKALQDSTEPDGTRELILLKRDDLVYVNADWGQLIWYASRKQGNTDYLTLGRCIIYPDRSNPRHFHPNCDEILTVMQGTIHHTWNNGEVIEMSEGDTIMIPVGVQHQARNVGTTNAILLIAFTSADRQTIGEQ